MKGKVCITFLSLVMVSSKRVDNPDGNLGTVSGFSGEDRSSDWLSSRTRLMADSMAESMFVPFWRSPEALGIADDSSVPLTDEDEDAACCLRSSDTVGDLFFLEEKRTHFRTIYKLLLISWYFSTYSFSNQA